MFPCLKLRLHGYPGRLQPNQRIVDRRLPHVGVQPPFGSRPPEDNNHDLPNHQDAPQPSPLYKSLFGLARCRRSQPEISESPLNPTD
ncbi:hypothetical protein FRC11_014952, partial [Ceratobasidium sp. 423]